MREAAEVLRWSLRRRISATQARPLRHHPTPGAVPFRPSRNSLKPLLQRPILYSTLYCSFSDVSAAAPMP